ncbi:MAG: DNA/RNA non-specific endonuclease, partial [Prevotella sp.]|nr:DNA/RNA non-specific endonuclease [Prevotella sp.]
TCSIDYLEEQTGLDFFCNLMDNIEDEVEASFRLEDWQW